MDFSNEALSKLKAGFESEAEVQSATPLQTPEKDLKSLAILQKIRTFTPSQKDSASFGLTILPLESDEKTIVYNTVEELLSNAKSLHKVHKHKLLAVYLEV